MPQSTWRQNGLVSKGVKSRRYFFSDSNSGQKCFESDSTPLAGGMQQWGKKNGGKEREGQTHGTSQPLTSTSGCVGASSTSSTSCACACASAGSSGLTPIWASEGELLPSLPSDTGSWPSSAIPATDASVWGSWLSGEDGRLYEFRRQTPES